VKMSGIFNNKAAKAPKKTIDPWTSRTYESRNQCYQALAASEGMDPTYTLGWYDLCWKYPLRFVDYETQRPIDGRGRLANP
jgi:hypothetical protein